MSALRQAQQSKVVERNKARRPKVTDEDWVCGENLFDFTMIQSNALR